MASAPNTFPSPTLMRHSIHSSELPISLVSHFIPYFITFLYQYSSHKCLLKIVFLFMVPLFKFPQWCWFVNITWSSCLILTYWMKIQNQNQNHNSKTIRTFWTVTQLLTALEFCKGRDCEIVSRQFRRPCLAKCSDCWHFVLLIYKLVRIFTVQI